MPKFQALSWLRIWSIYFRSQGKLAHFIPVVNSLPHAGQPWPVCSQTRLYCRKPKVWGCCSRAHVCGLVFHLVRGTGIILEDRNKGSQGIFPLPVSLESVSGSYWVSFLTGDPIRQAHHSSNFQWTLITVFPIALHSNILMASCSGSSLGWLPYCLQTDF